jgi:hypothetical protein
MNIFGGVPGKNYAEIAETRGEDAKHKSNCHSQEKTHYSCMHADPVALSGF